MPIIRNGEEYFTLEELRSLLKAQNRKRAEEIPQILRKKQEEYYV